MPANVRTISTLWGLPRVVGFLKMTVAGDDVYCPKWETIGCVPKSLKSQGSLGGKTNGVSLCKSCKDELIGLLMEGGSKGRGSLIFPKVPQSSQTESFGFPRVPPPPFFHTPGPEPYF